jgi:hypothetical protein
LPAPPDPLPISERAFLPQPVLCGPCPSSDIDHHDCPSPISSLASLRLLQHTALYRSLVAQGFEMAELDETGQTPVNPTFQIFEPDLTFGPVDCAMFFKLAKLPGGAFRPEELVPDSPPLVRHEAVFTTLWRLSERFDSILVVFEKPGRVTEAFTPPVVRALEELKGEIAKMCEMREDHGRLLVDLAFVDSPGQGAKVVREFSDKMNRWSEGDLGPAQTWLDVDVSEVRQGSGWSPVSWNLILIGGHDYPLRTRTCWSL